MSSDKKEKAYTPRDPSVVSFTMSRIRGKNTGIELALRKALYEEGKRYRCNSNKVFGHPDVVFPRIKLAIFADSSFWHGYNFEAASAKIHAHTDYWIPKIKRNMERDVEVNEELKREGYTVLRYWDFEIEKELPRVKREILEAIDELEAVEEMREKGLVKTTLCYLEKGDSYLMLHRIKKENDLNEGKWIGVGGHVEEGESILSCLKREIKEETGLILKKYRYRGYVDFLNDLYPPERMYLYVGTSFEGELLDCPEGDLEWVRKKDVMSLDIWEGDRAFLPLLEKEEAPFHMSLVYHSNELVKVIGPAYQAKKKAKKKKR
ncbi:MAG: DNA mismatch endonuclease Vsr [Bacilli bacterium]|nr:DNA mismatch endonuclease Vsr [Bacilli bacterium]